MRLVRLGALSIIAAALSVPVVIRASAHLRAGTSSPAQLHVAVAEGNKIVILNILGGDRKVIVTGLSQSAHPWYSWAPDGKYLLVVRSRSAGSDWALLLADRNGASVRTIARAVSSTGFYPAWAVDGDRIAYLARIARGHSAPTIDTVGPNGDKSPLWRYPETQQGGCGGGVSDPAQLALSAQTGSDGMTFPLQWSMSRHLAIAWVPNGSALIDTRTGAVRHLGKPHQELGEVVLSSSGQLAATLSICVRKQCGSQIVLADPRTGAVTRIVGQGELPTGSPDGRFVYFVRRVPGRLLHVKDTRGNAASFQTYTSSIWRADQDGSHLRRLASEDAYGFGFLNVTPDGQSLVFSRVDNEWKLWGHRLADDRYTDRLLRRYGPRVQVQRLDIGRPPVTIATDAGMPAIQP